MGLCRDEINRLPIYLTDLSHVGAGCAFHLIFVNIIVTEISNINKYYCKCSLTTYILIFCSFCSFLMCFLMQRKYVSVVLNLNSVGHCMMCASRKVIGHSGTRTQNPRALKSTTLAMRDLGTTYNRIGWYFIGKTDTVHVTNVTFKLAYNKSILWLIYDKSELRIQTHGRKETKMKINLRVAINYPKHNCIKQLLLKKKDFSYKNKFFIGTSTRMYKKFRYQCGFFPHSSH